MKLFSLIFRSRNAFESFMDTDKDEDVQDFNGPAKHNYLNFILSIHLYICECDICHGQALTKKLQNSGWKTI